MKSISSLITPRKKKRRRKRGRRGSEITLKRIEPNFKYSTKLRKVNKCGTNDMFVDNTANSSNSAQMNAETKARKQNPFLSLSNHNSCDNYSQF